LTDEVEIEKLSLSELNKDNLLNFKRKGFSDSRIADLIESSEEDVRLTRKSLNVLPVFKRVDTCAAEFESSTAYMYSTYEENAKPM
jgi:carbamoyl-phosphate synthase large subunit